MENKRLIIIDSNALLHRAFHALPPLATKNGEQTGAVFGYFLTLFKAINDLKPGFIVACFDTKAKTFRHEKFSDYKGTRAKTPDEIILQLPKAKLILEKFGIPVYAKEGFEADDLIATICSLSQKQDKDLEIFILSGDLDNLQLVNDKIKVYTIGKGIKDTIIYDEEKVMSRFGVRPDQMIDFKALTGDATDNVPGVEGIGKTTAADLIQRFGSLENIYSELATDTAVLKPKIKEALKKDKNVALLSRELVEMKKDVPIDFDLEKCKFGNFDTKAVAEIFGQFEFNTLISRLSSLKYN
jgi:DNA polymerase-1